MQGLHQAAQPTVHPPPASIRITRTQPQIRNSTTNTQSKSKEHSFLQININSIQGKTDELAELVTEIKATLIAVQETKLQHRNKTSTIASYTACRRDRPSGPGGGLLLHIHKDAQFTEINRNYGISLGREFHHPC